MSKKKNALSAMGIPELNLKANGVAHEVPEHMQLEMHIEWKLGGVPKEVINPVRAIIIHNGTLKVANRNVDTWYNYDVSEVRKAYLLPM